MQTNSKNRPSLILQLHRPLDLDVHVYICGKLPREGTLVIHSFIVLKTKIYLSGLLLLFLFIIFFSLVYNFNIWIEKLWPKSINI